MRLFGVRSWLDLVTGLLAAAFVTIAPASATGWHRADSAHFRVHGERAPADLATEARLLEAFRLLVAELKTADAGGPDAALPVAPLDVFLVRAPDRLSAWLPLRPGVAGFYRADAGRISAVVVDRPARAPFDITPREVLLHEVAHHLLLAGGLNWPAWYVEGFADYVSTAAFAAGQVELGRAGANRLGWLQRGDWLPIDRILAFDPERAPPADVARFYAQSWLLVHWLRHDEGRARHLQAYLAAFAAGADPVEAFRQHVAADLPSVETALRAYLASGPVVIVRAAPGPEAVRPVAVAALPASAGSLLMRRVALEHGLVPADARAALVEVRRLAGRAPSGDPLAAHALARAELALGDPRTARQVAEALLSAAPADPERLRLYAEAVRAAPDRPSVVRQAEARQALLKALAVDPLDWRALYALARLDRSGGPDRPARLLRARELAPQVKAIALETAVSLAQAGRLSEAGEVLATIAHAPAAGEAGALARRMLAHAHGGDGAALLAEAAAVRTAATIASAQAQPPAQGR